MDDYVCGLGKKTTKSPTLARPCGFVMTSLLPFNAGDLLDCNAINLDVLTENYHISFYLEYMYYWPDLLFKSVSRTRNVGYMIGKSEGTGLEWHSHITAVTVDMEYRRLGLGRVLVDLLKLASEAPDQNCYFMDLYVRTSNRIAVDMYKLFGFAPFRRVGGYYGAGRDQDAFDMRMPLKRDPHRKSLIKGPHTYESSQNRYKYDKKSLS